MEAVSKEIWLGLSSDDFEPGDRFYWTDKGGNIRYGTVVSSEETAIIVKGDLGEDMNFCVPKKEGFKFLLSCCGKPMDFSKIKEGSMISCQSINGSRDYVRITEYNPGVILKGEYLKKTDRVFEIHHSEYASIEQKMAYWELED